MIAITKGMAQVLFNKGKNVMIAPNRLLPNSYKWKKLVSPINANTANGQTFAKVCEVISFYNCNDRNGMGLAYYAEEIE